MGQYYTNGSMTWSYDVVIIDSTALFFLCATAHANMADAGLSGFFDNGCPKDTSIKKLLPHVDCRQYYECHNGGLISRLCANGLNFNAELETCDWNFRCYNAVAQSNEDSEAMMRKETDSEELDFYNLDDAYEICQSPGSNGILVAHENCNEFYKCVYGRPVNLKCARDLLYNIINEKCDWPHNVECGERVSAVRGSNFSMFKTNQDAAFPYTSEEVERSKSDPKQTSTICSYENSDGVLVAHEYCNRYYKCYAGVPKTVKCPINLMYNPVKERCDWPWNVDCGGRSIPENEEKNNLRHKKSFHDTKQSIYAAVICANENSEGISVAHEMCSHFYKCSEGEPVVHSCPGNQLYNSDQGYCDRPRNVACNDRTLPGHNGESESHEDNTIEDNDNKDLRHAITICSAIGSDGMLLNHKLCNQFYECHDGQPVVVTCPPLLFYKPETESCEWPTYVSCNDRKHL